MLGVGKAHFDDDEGSTIPRNQLGTYSYTESSSKLTQAAGGWYPTKHDWAAHMPTMKRLFIDEDKTLKEVMGIMSREYGFIAPKKMFKMRLPRKRNYYGASELDVQDKLLNKSSQKQKHLRIISRVPYEFLPPHPAESLTSKVHDVFHVYEAIFHASRDYASARFQNTVETPGYIIKAYCAVYLICGLLSADQSDKNEAPAARRKPRKHARVLVLNELTHLIPCMFTQVVLLANGSGKLAGASMTPLQCADAAASKVPGWPPRHPVRRILSNLVILGHSEDPTIVSQVAENARKCVLETCDNEGLRSVAHRDRLRGHPRLEEGDHFQETLPPTTPEGTHRVDTEYNHRVGSSFNTRDLQPSQPLQLAQAERETHSNPKNNLHHDDELQHATGRHARIHKHTQLITAANHADAATATALEQGSVDTLKDQSPGKDPGLGTPPVQQGEHDATGREDDSPYQNSAEKAVLVSKDTGDGMGIFDHFRLYVEHIFGEELDWRPLPPIKHPLGRCQSRISWTYNGMKMSVLLDAAETMRLSRHGNDYHGNSSVLPICQPPAHTAASASTYTSGSVESKTSAWKKFLPWSRTRDNGGCIGPSKHPGDKGTSQHMESHLCVDKCWSSTHDTRMITLESVEHMKSDFDYFCQARHILSQAEGGWLQRKLSWRSYTRVTLSRFHFLFDNSDKVEAIEFNSLPSPQDVCCGYEFKCSQRAEVDIQMRIYAKIILEGIRQPELGRGSRTLLDGIPKLKAPPGLAKKAMNSGWGFHARHGLSVVKMLGWTMVILVLGLGFVPFWLSSIDSLDLQSALAPASFLITVVTLWVAVLAVNSGFKE